MIETLNGKRNLKIQLSRESIPFYQKEILKLSSTNFFLPMRFVFQELNCLIFYDCSERISLEQYLKGKKSVGIQSFVEEGIVLLEHLLEQIQQGENHLLFLDDYQLCLETLFVYEKKQRIESMFLPKENKNDFSEEWEKLLTSIESVVEDPQWNVYSQRLKKVQKEMNLGVQELLFHLRDMEGEVVYSHQA